jgi:hypothetical protein
MTLRRHLCIPLNVRRSAVEWAGVGEDGRRQEARGGGNASVNVNRIPPQVPGAKITGGLVALTRDSLITGATKAFGRILVKEVPKQLIQLRMFFLHVERLLEE